MRGPNKLLKLKLNRYKNENLKWEQNQILHFYSIQKINKEMFKAVWAFLFHFYSSLSESISLGYSMVPNHWSGDQALSPQRGLACIRQKWWILCFKRMVKNFLIIQYFNFIISLKRVMMNQITPKHMLDYQILLKL